MEMEASENPALDSIKADPTLVATAFRKNRFYLFTRRDATDTKSVDTDRDVFNEKPSKEDIIAATEQGGDELADILSPDSRLSFLNWIVAATFHSIPVA